MPITSLRQGHGGDLENQVAADAMTLETEQDAVKSWQTPELWVYGDIKSITFGERGRLRTDGSSGPVA